MWPSRLCGVQRPSFGKYRVIGPTMAT
jgi:hypothetical protein